MALSSASTASASSPTRVTRAGSLKGLGRRALSPYLIVAAGGHETRPDAIAHAPIRFDRGAEGPSPAHRPPRRVRLPGDPRRPPETLRQPRGKPIPDRRRG